MSFKWSNLECKMTVLQNIEILYQFPNVRSIKNPHFPFFLYSDLEKHLKYKINTLIKSLGMLLYQTYINTEIREHNLISIKQLLITNIVLTID